MAKPPVGSYDAFAAYYDAYWAAGYLRDVEEGLEDAILPLVPPGARVLDLCCGPGRLAKWLGDRGFQVTGIDISGPMIDEARRNAPEARFLQADARSFELDERVDMALSTFDSVNHFATLAELENVFSSVHKALTEDGFFCFDFNTQEAFEYAGGETYAMVDDDHVCISKSVYNKRAGQGVSRLTVFEREGDVWRRKDAEVREYHHHRKDIEACLTRAGFGRPKVFDAADDFGMPHGDGRLFLLVRPR